MRHRHTAHLGHTVTFTLNRWGGEQKLFHFVANDDSNRFIQTFELNERFDLGVLERLIASAKEAA